MANNQSTTTRREALKHGGAAAVTVAAGLTLPATLAAADDSRLRTLYEKWARLKGEVDKAYRVSADLEPDWPDYPPELSYTVRSGRTLPSGHDRPLAENEIRAWLIPGEEQKRLLKLLADFDYQRDLSLAMSGYHEAHAKAEALHDEMTRTCQAIAGTPARTWEGMGLKAKLAEEYAELDRVDTDPATGYLDDIIVASIVKDAERLSGGAT